MAALFTLATSSGVLAGEPLPTVGGKTAVATVNGEPITPEELDQALAMRHVEAQEGNKVGKVDYSEILDRLINTRLIVLEARNIGLDQLPEVKEDVNNYSRVALVEVLLRRQTADLRVTDNEVETKYRDIVTEYKVQSLLFAKEADAKSFEADVRSGKDFGTIANQVLDGGIATGKDEAAYVKSESLLPGIKAVVSGMAVGSVSHVIPVPSGFTVLKLEEVRVPEIPEAREQAREALLSVKRFETSRAYVESLKKEYVQVKRDVLDGLDYDGAPAGFQALLADRRAVAEVKGEEPVTVGQLSDAIQRKFFHGIERAAEKKSVNAKKTDVLDMLLNQRVVRKEALRLGLDKSEAYRAKVTEYENSVLFGVFLQKVVRPGIRVEDKDIKAYYEKHIAEFSSPERVRFDSLAFFRKARAKEAMHKLNEGADFAWVGANADGQLDRNSEDQLQFGAKLVAVNTLPEDVRGVVTGASPGDIRLYESPGGYAYVLVIREVNPPKPQAIDQVIGEIAGKVTAARMKRDTEEYARNLRKAYAVKVFIKEPKP